MIHLTDLSSPLAPGTDHQPRQPDLRQGLGEERRRGEVSEQTHTKKRAPQESYRGRAALPARRLHLGQKCFELVLKFPAPAPDSYFFVIIF